MRSVLISSIIHAIVIATCLPASAATHHAPSAHVAKCDTPVADMLKVLAEGAKSLSISKALTDKQYAFLKAIAKNHSTAKKGLPGDGAFVIASDGDFIVALTQGLDESAMVCAVMRVPAELVAGIVAADKPVPKSNSKDELKL